MALASYFMTFAAAAGSYFDPIHTSRPSVFDKTMPVAGNGKLRLTAQPFPLA
jgi:hypothetical protein